MTINPSNAILGYIRLNHKDSKIFESLLNLVMLVLSEEYPYARVSVDFQLFLHHFVMTKLATSSIRVKNS